MFLKHLRLYKKCIDTQEKSKTVSCLNNSKAVKRINITQLNNGESAKVVGLDDNSEIMSKLEAMGIMLGAIITKKSAIFARGPIVLEKDLVQFAIGYNIAQKIIVEPVNTGRGGV